MKPPAPETTRLMMARYLLVNLHARYLLSDWGWLRTLVAGGKQNDGPRYAGNTAAEADTARISASIKVIDTFFRGLPEFVGLPPERVLFTMDGFRYPDEAKEGVGTYFDQMRRAFRERAETRGYEVIDVDPLFFADFRQHGRRFEDCVIAIETQWPMAL